MMHAQFASHAPLEDADAYDARVSSGADSCCEPLLLMTRGCAHPALRQTVTSWCYNAWPVGEQELLKAQIDS